jgi:hypothetical protein
MTMNLGYLVGTAIFLSVLVLLVIWQIAARRFHPFLYWATIIASTTAGTTMADYATRSLPRCWRWRSSPASSSCPSVRATVPKGKAALRQQPRAWQFWSGRGRVLLIAGHYLTKR